MNSLSIAELTILTIDPPLRNAATVPQRFPIIFWLLLAATLSVDAVMFSWVASEPFPVPTFVMETFLAMILSQLSIVCIWSAVGSNSILRRSSPLPAVILAALLITIGIDSPVTAQEEFTSTLAFHGLHAAILLAALWLLQRSAFWRRRTGATHQWQYSLAQVLIFMTAAATLAALMRNSRLLGGWINFTFLFSSVALTVASVYLWSLPWSWPLRLAAVLGLALLLGFGLWPITNSIIAFFLGAHYLIQAVVLSVWLGCGPILPPMPATTAARS